VTGPAAGTAGYRRGRSWFRRAVSVAVCGAVHLHPAPSTEVHTVRWPAPVDAGGHAETQSSGLL